MANTIHVDVVSAEEQIYSGEAEFVILPGIEGELGVFPRHTPLFTQIRPGAVRIKLPDQEQEELHRLTSQVHSLTVPHQLVRSGVELEVTESVDRTDRGSAHGRAKACHKRPVSASLAFIQR